MTMSGFCEKGRIENFHKKVFTKKAIVKVSSSSECEYFVSIIKANMNYELINANYKNR